MSKINGSKITGGNPSRGRIENDYYATNPISTKALLKVEFFTGDIYEPACGEGHISKILKKHQYTVYSSDLVDRGYGQGDIDFLKANWSTVDNIVTNPPFKLFQEFAEKSLELAKNKVAFFGKLQALEGIKRATFLENTPLETIYVFKKRQQPLINGTNIDILTGKKMASSTMAFAWFVWNKKCFSRPVIKWI